MNPYPRKPLARARPGTAADYAEFASRFLARREIDLALASTEDALRLGASAASVTYQRWMCFMLAGDFESAWRESDRSEAARRSLPPGLIRQREQNLPLHLRRVWDGSPLDHRNVLVRCYHGLGDTIQFVRYLPLLRSRARRVYLQCQRELASLFASLPAKDALFFLDEDRGALDACVEDDCVEIELMELAYAFRTTLETIPNQVPYLHLPSSAYRSMPLPCEKRDFKVGVTWSSGNWNPERNIPLALFEKLLPFPRLALFSLQRGAAADEIGTVPHLRITQTEKESGTILDTAATILRLDLIISVDTMVAHLAGALGKPVWLLLPFRADWRWMLARDDSPWYPTMCIFRQPRPGDWRSVVDRVAVALVQICRL